MTQVAGQMSGMVLPRYEPVRQLFESMLGEDADYSAGLCAYVAGEKVIDLVGGPHLGATSLVPVFSSTKGAAGICMALLIDRGQLDLDATVSSYWPEFAAAGKQHVTVRQLLSHQAGLVTVDGGISLTELLGHTEVAERLASQRPFWYPGAAHGYHSVTIGTLADELVRRITGESLSAFYEANVRQPAGADFYVGLPETEIGRVLPVLPQLDPTGEQMDWMALASGPWTLMRVLMGDGRTDFPRDPRDLANNPDVWRVGPPAVGGLATAAGLAAVYALTITGITGISGTHARVARLLSPQTVAAVSQLQTRGPDMVLGVERAFAIVFQKPIPILPFGSYWAFGHDGAGGSMAFADPQYGMAFGYVPARMTWPGGADPRAHTLAAAIRECVTK
jgi:CubicO group peptidase (beta-lactamase class C family)